MAKKTFGSGLINAFSVSTEKVEEAIENPQTFAEPIIQDIPGKPGRKRKPAPAEPYTLCSVKIPNSIYVKLQAIAKQNKEPLRDLVIRLAIERMEQINSQPIL